jgi:hypothetical protein
MFDTGGAPERFRPLHRKSISAPALRLRSNDLIARRRGSNRKPPAASPLIHKRQQFAVRPIRPHWLRVCISQMVSTVDAFLLISTGRKSRIPACALTERQPRSPCAYIPAEIPAGIISGYTVSLFEPSPADGTLPVHVPTAPLLKQRRPHSPRSRTSASRVYSSPARPRKTKRF